MWMCGAMVLGALVIVIFTGNAFAFVPVIGCVLMMIVMMQLMGGMGGRGDDRQKYTQRLRQRPAMSAANSPRRPGRGARARRGRGHQGVPIGTGWHRRGVEVLRGASLEVRAGELV